MIKLNKYGIITLLMIISSSVMLSCNSKNVQITGKDKGWVAFNTSVSEKTQVKSDVSELPIIIEMYNSANELSYTFEYNNVTETKQEVAEGQYTVKAYTTPVNEGAVFDIPSFETSKKVTVSPFVINPIELTLTYNVAKITVSYTDKLLSNITTDFQTTITNNTTNDKLVFVGNDSRIGYMVPGESYTYQFEVKQPNGTTWALVKETGIISAADHLDINFDISDKEEVVEPNSMVSIKINESLNDVLTSLYIDLTEVTPPTITSSTFNIDEPFAVKSGSALSSEILLDINSTLPVGKLIINGEKELFSSFSLPRLCDLLSMDQNTASLFNTAGIYVTKNTDTNVTLDMSALISALSPGETGNHVYYFNLTVVDNMQNSHEKVIAFDVTGKQVKIYEVISVPKGDNGDNFYMEMTAAWQGANCPDGATLQYQTNNSGEWITVPKENLTKDNITKIYYYKLPVPANTEVICRTVMIDENGNITDLGEEELYASSADNINVPNLSFDTWNNGYPNADGGNSYWASGNDGVTGFPVNKSPNTAPETSKVISGKAAKLFTYTGIPVVGVAAGNLFTGSYKTNITNPSSSVNFGRPFSGRPKGMRGYFCYQSGGNVDGAPDRCDIYIQLENRSNGNVKVGYGGFQTDRNTGGKYENFRFDITYESDLPVTHVTLVATSSYKGGDFKGASNSTLYVDEFELIY